MIFSNWNINQKKLKDDSSVVPFLRTISGFIFNAFLSLLFTLATHLTISASDFKVITEKGKSGLIDDNGNIVIPVIYDNLGWSDGHKNLIDEVFGYYENGKWGLINTKNERITGPEYSELFPTNNGFLIASRINVNSGAHLFGVLDIKGQAKLGFQYHAMLEVGNYLISGQEKDGLMKWGVLDFEERPIIPIRYDKVEVLHLNFVVYLNDTASIFSLDGSQLTEFKYDQINELGSYFILYDQQGKMGLANMLGNVISEPQYKSIRLNNDSSATFTEFPKWELILPESGTIKEFYYDQIIPVSHGIYHVTMNGKEAIINSEEEYLLNGNDWEITVPDDQFVLVRQQNKFGVLKEGGISVLPLEFDSIYYSGKHFYGLTVEDKEEKWQIYSKFGSLISSSHFDAVFPMSEELIATSKNGYWGYIDFTGHTVIEYKYDYAWPFKDGRAKVNYLGNQGIINTVGEWVVYPNHSEVTVVNKELYINHTGQRLDLLDGLERTIYQTYNLLKPHSYGLLEETAAGKYGLVDQTGISHFPPVYDYISELLASQVYVLKRGSIYSVIGNDGKVINDRIEDIDHIGNLSEGFLSVKKDGKYGFIDLDGNLRIANRYSAIRDFKEGMAAVELVGKWGFIDRLERIRIQPLYQQVGDFQRGVSIVKKNGFYGIIDMEGREVLKMEYDSISRNIMNSFIVRKADRYGLANLKGELVVTPKYELLEENSNGYLIVKQRGKYGVIKKNGINVIPTIYQDIIYDEINGYYLAKSPSEERNLVTK